MRPLCGPTAMREVMERPTSSGIGSLGVDRFAQIELLGVALQQSSHPAGDCVGQLRELGRGRLTYPLEAKAGPVGRPFVDAVRSKNLRAPPETLISRLSHSVLYN